MPRDRAHRGCGDAHDSLHQKVASHLIVAMLKIQLVGLFGGYDRAALIARAGTYIIAGAFGPTVFVQILEIALVGVFCV